MLSEEKKYALFRVKGFKTHPIDCKIVEGYTLRLASYVLNTENITNEHTKCSFDGHPFDEFLIRWK